MKHLYTKIIFASLLLPFISLKSFSQKDTTELEIGKKRLIIIDKKTQQENAIYNLEKGKQTFANEIANTKKIIKQKEAELKNKEQELKTIISEISKYEQDSTKTNLEKNRIELEKQRIELEKTRIEISKIRATIEANKKKQKAFESGIVEIEKGIAEIEAGLKDINAELNSMAKNDEIEQKTIKQKKLGRRFNAHWAGFEFGLLNFTNENQEIISDDEATFMRIRPEKTFTYGLNIFEYNIPLTRNTLGIATGAGLRWNSIYLEEDISLVENEDGVIVSEIVDENIEDFKKNRLNIAYIKIPVLLEYQKQIKRRKLFFSTGIFGEMRAWSKQKQVYVIDDVKIKNKKVDSFQLSPFRYGVSARVGYGGIGLFFEYVFIPLFKEDKGPEMYPVMIGLRLVDF
ncbi:MAG: outer membrane beta-barrel protein [Chlorobi bacterium]|nr:outer membrane beta-barrel protein [Chlorobiota bacterium]